MKKLIKWACYGSGLIIVLLITTILIVPQIVDVQKYKPQIENAVADATGRPFELGGDLDMSTFPWLGVSLSDLRLGNPEGFQNKTFISVKSFEVRIKLIPLLFKQIEVKQFVMVEPEIFLTRLVDGKTNWEDLGKPTKGKTIPTTSKKESKKSTSSTHLPIKSLTVGKFSITNGLLIFSDADKKTEISNINLDLKNVSLDTPIEIDFRAMVDGKLAVINGKIGPLGEKPGKGDVALDLSFDLIEQLKIAIIGKLIDPLSVQKFDLAFEVAPFSPRKIMNALDRPFPLNTTDPGVMNTISLKAKIKGSPSEVVLSDGELILDDSNFSFMLAAADFSKPDLTFDINLDWMDVDRYLPPKPEKQSPRKQEKKPTKQNGKPDYEPLRKMILDGKVKIGKLKANNAKIENFILKIKGKNGVFDIGPLSLDLYKGNLLAKVNLDVGRDLPLTHISLNTKSVQVGPLLRDIFNKDTLEGALTSDIALRFKGDSPEMIKQTLNGKGDLIFRDGAIIGIDLAGMVRNIASQFGIGDELKERPKTDFAELNAPFTTKNGQVHTSGTTIAAPMLRVVVRGDADLVSESINMRIEPKFVATLTGQGDSEKRSGITVPIIVTGTFSDLKFRPDLEGIIDLNKIDTDSLRENLPETDGLEESLKSIGEKGKNFFNGLFSD